MKSTGTTLMKDQKRQFGKRQTILMALAVFVSTIAYWAYSRNVAQAENHGGFSTNTIRQNPVHIGPIVNAPPLIGTPIIPWLKQETQTIDVKNREYLNPSACIHLVKCFGQDIQLSIESELGIKTIKALDLVLDPSLGKRVFGQACCVKTRYGIRFPTLETSGPRSYSDESHRDQCLASFAEFGVPSDYPIVIEGENFSIRDAIADSTANFHLDQGELEWTLIAYSLYLPGKSGWQNRFGERFTFDQAAIELMDRSIEEASCGGTHRFFALNTMQRVDDEISLFSPPVRKRVTEFIQQAIACAVSSQKADGSWNFDWNRALFATEAAMQTRDQKTRERGNLIMTGHLAEWLLYLPQSQQVDPLVLRNCSHWLSYKMQLVSEEEFWRGICPYTHAYCSLCHSKPNDERDR